MKKFIFLITLILVVAACRSVPIDNSGTSSAEVVIDPTTFVKQPTITSSPTSGPSATPFITPTPTTTPTEIIEIRTPVPTATERTRGTAVPGRPTRSEPTATPVILEMLNPLIDMGDELYLGFQGGLYPDGSNDVPFEHAEAGLAKAAMIQPLDLQGNPDPQGKIVLLSVGMSNTSQEFCFGRQARASCLPWTFVGMAEQDPTVNHDTLFMIDGARGGQVALKWDSPDDENYDRVLDDILTPLNLSEHQVQIAWLKVANPGPRFSLPNERADAYQLVSSMGAIVRTLKTQYPNLKLVFISSRIFAGYATNTLNPEPFAYESGFAVKWLIEAQIDQMMNHHSPLNDLAGDLNYETVAPWLAWGPYLWANGTTSRSDGLIWETADFDTDFTHPSQAGETKVATLLMDFFQTSPFTQCWFLADRNCQSN